MPLLGMSSMMVHIVVHITTLVGIHRLFRIGGRSIRIAVGNIGAIVLIVCVRVSVAILRLRGLCPIDRAIQIVGRVARVGVVRRLIIRGIGRTLGLPAPIGGVVRVLRPALTRQEQTRLDNAAAI